MQRATVAASPAAAQHVLILEDDETFASVLRVALESRHYNVDTVRTPTDFAQAIARYEPNLVVLDVFLGGVSGIDILKGLHQTRPDLPVLMMSGMGTVAIAVEAIKLGATDFLEKPFSIEAFIERVARCVATRPASDNSAPRLSVLTGREHEVLAQIARGASSKEAGRVLGISPRTVDVHRARIKEKLNVRRAVDLVRLVYSGETR